jgi:CRP-like cAMP-binding protein
MEIKFRFIPGMSFGEIALISKSRRTGTVICNENCILMILDGNGFEKLIGV